MDKNKIKLLVIVGPTASGKSDLGIRIAQKFNGEIISADSRQIYRGLDIGTGKVSKKEQRLVPHHLLDVASPKRVFTVSQFKKQAEKAIRDITKRGKLPIIVGGTGHYIDTLVYDMNLPEVPPNHKLRAKLEKLTVEQLFQQLQKLDPVRASSIDPHNPRRLMRALEIIEATGKPIGTIELKSPYQVLWLGLNPKDLERRISKRLQKRFKQGLVAEVKNLKLSSKRLNDLGLEYRFVSQYLQNKTSKQDLLKNLEQAIRQYAKRQMTWFKRNKEIRWLRKPTESLSPVREFLSSAAE